ncbi:MAG: transposase [Boseongicola sp. SB0670_bin_30]|nr:transposase [Boseongicola sp. SB0670_bin_30]
MLTCKAGSAGGSVVLVDQRGISQRCSECGADSDGPKTLGERVHGCDGCGLVLDRDVNAARNVLQLVRGREPACGREACRLLRSLAERPMSSGDGVFTPCLCWSAAGSVRSFH